MSLPTTLSSWVRSWARAWSRLIGGVGAAVIGAEVCDDDMLNRA